MMTRYFHCILLVFLCAGNVFFIAILSVLKVFYRLYQSFLHAIKALDLNLGELDLTSQDEFILDEVNGWCQIILSGE